MSAQPSTSKHPASHPTTTATALSSTDEPTSAREQLEEAEYDQRQIARVRDFADIDVSDLTATNTRGIAGYGTPAAAAAPKAPADFDDDERVTVTFGPVTFKKDERVYLGGLDKVDPEKPAIARTYEFKGGVARDVPYRVARGWKRDPIGSAMHLLRRDATEAEILRKAGVQAPQPEKQAAMLLASDLDKLAEQFTPEQLDVLARKFREFAERSSAQHTVRHG